MIGAVDWSEYAGLLLVLAIMAYNFLKRIFGKKSAELEDFLKSIDEDEEALAKTPPPPPPPVIVKHKPKKEAKPPAPVPPVRHPATPNPVYYTLEQKRIVVQQEKLLNPRNLQKAMIIQTILNKPKGAWW